MESAGNCRVLSIQSHVVSGYVGNKSATFPLQVRDPHVFAMCRRDRCNLVSSINDGKFFRIGTVRYNWPMSAHASQAFSTAHCTDSEDLRNGDVTRF